MKERERARVHFGLQSGAVSIRPTSQAHLTEKWLTYHRRTSKAEFAFSIYDADGSNSIDCVDLGNVLRALNTNPTDASIEKLGGTKKRGEKNMSLEEFLPIFSQVKKDKDQGCYEDFIECLKLYDKQEDGTMLGAELSHVLVTLGERLTDAECESIVADCFPPEDEDGFIKYQPFVQKLMS